MGERGVMRRHDAFFVLSGGGPKSLWDFLLFVPQPFIIKNKYNQKVVLSQ